MKIAFAALAVLALPLSAASAPDLANGVYVPAAAIDAKVATLKDGVMTGQIPTGPGTTLLSARRDRDGEVEVHTHLNDEFIARAGRAKVRVGGSVNGNREVGPGEFRGGTMTGGAIYDLAPGDALWIPAGAPHQVLVPKGGSFSYLALKFEAAAPH